MNNETIKPNDNEVVLGGEEVTKVKEVIKEKPKTSKVEKNSKEVRISIDNGIEDIVQYQDEGYSIFFKDTAEELVQLTEDEIKELTPLNKQKYTLACGIRYQTLRLDDVKHANKFFKPRAGFASATDRLEIRGGDSSMHRFWKRPDELQKVAYEGGRVCKDPSVVTFGGVDVNGKSLSGSSVHEISANGEVELVLCETSKESNDARTKEIETKSQNRNAAVDEAARTEIAKLGGATKDFS